MGTLVDLSTARGRRHTEERSKPARGAEIVLFMGVRYERWADDAADTLNDPPPRKSAEKK